MNLAIFGQRIRTLSANVLAVASAITLTSGLWTHDASADNRVGEFITSATDWTYAPVITRLPNGSGTGGAGNSVITVDNILAVAKPGVANGENLIAVWYVRETSGGTTWAAKTWEDTTWPGIAQRLKDDLGLTDQELEIFGQGPTGSAAASAPANYTGGFIEGDPMIQIVNDADPTTREMLVDILKDVGYKIADPVFDEKDDCGRDAKLNYYATASSDILSQVTESSAQVVAAIYLDLSVDPCLRKPFSPGTETIYPVPNGFVPSNLIPVEYKQPRGPCRTGEGPGGIDCRDFHVEIHGTQTYQIIRFSELNGLVICELVCRGKLFAVMRCCGAGICGLSPSEVPCNAQGLQPAPNPDYKSHFRRYGPLTCDLPINCEPF
jgi:hypothetical protein